MNFHRYETCNIFIIQNNEQSRRKFPLTSELIIFCYKIGFWNYIFIDFSWLWKVVVQYVPVDKRRASEDYNFIVNNLKSILKTIQMKPPKSTRRFGIIKSKTNSDLGQNISFLTYKLRNWIRHYLWDLNLSM